MDTEIKNAVHAADQDAPYDRSAKRLLSNKHILAYIFITLISDFKGMPAREAEKYIEGDVYVNTVPIEPGLTNKAEKGDEIAGLNTEDGEVHEGIIRYDIIFYVRLRDGLAQIIVNIEMQKDKPSEYKLLNRAIFYVCRLVSSQKERDFANSNFDDIKRVYSVWICPYTKGNYIKHIHLTSEDILESCELEGNLELLNIMLVGLNDKVQEHDERYELHRLLSTLLSEELTPDEKLAIMNQEYEIPIDQDIREEVDKMYTLSQHIEERARAKGIEDGRTERDIEYIVNMHRKGYTLEQIADISEKTMKEVENILKNKKPILA